ncbi:MAG: recombinase family protein [Oscillospiraceae bacterium]|nr:recombinase family protein [Oscillospiraceae bacterium]
MLNGETREDLRQIYRREDTGEKTFIPAKPKVDLYGENHIFRVCAYCRVSTENEEQLSSFELQQAHYRQLVQDHPNWNLKQIYADEGISGTSLKKYTFTGADYVGILYFFDVLPTFNRACTPPPTTV